MHALTELKMVKSAERQKREAWPPKETERRKGMSMQYMQMRIESNAKIKNIQPNELRAIDTADGVCVCKCVWPDFDCFYFDPF